MGNTFLMEKTYCCIAYCSTQKEEVLNTAYIKAAQRISTGACKECKMYLTLSFICLHGYDAKLEKGLGSIRSLLSQ